METTTYTNNLVGVNPVLSEEAVDSIELSIEQSIATQSGQYAKRIEKGVVVNDDFSFIGKDGKTYTLQPKQKLFADYYLASGGGKIEAIIEAGYDINYKDNKGRDTGVPNRERASTMAYELLHTKPHITVYINSEMSKMGFNKDNVREQHLFCLNQHIDIKTKMKAVSEFYKLNGEYPKEPKGDINIAIFSLSELADKTQKQKQLDDDEE